MFPRLPRRALPVLVACAALAGAGTFAAPGAASSGNRAQYLRQAENGMQRLDQVWWNPQAHWYTTYPWVSTDGAGGLATLWDVAPVFETVDLIAIADPRPANVAAVKAFAIGAERYWDPGIWPHGGYAYLPGKQGNVGAFFDDNGWWGLGLFDAYRATHDRRFLVDAIRAFRFIIAAGWATHSGGGVWWDTGHTKKTAEPLAAAALLGAEIYRTTHVGFYLRQSLKLIDWADLHSWNASRNLYQRSDVSDTVMNYVQGMMIGAHAVLCQTLRQRSYCRKAEQLAQAAQVAFPLSYHWAPETDAIYLRWLLQLWAVDHNPRWYAVADYWGQQALENARDANGLYTKGWDGGFASPDRILTDAGTLMLFAAIAASPAPPGS